MRKSNKFSASAVALLVLSAAGVSASTYDVGPGKASESLSAVPWASLAPGDTVRIHWRKEPYREKLLISVRGTAEQPITITGVKSPDGKLPIIDGASATTNPQLDFVYTPMQARGLVTISAGKRHKWGYKPGYLVIENLQIQGAAATNSFTDARGETKSYTFNAAALYIERGEHITIRGCTITGSGNGLFVASGQTEEVQSRDFLVERCRIFGNGNPGRFREHNVYTEAIGITFQYNYLGRPRQGALGNTLKDRSAGTTIRYNWIEGGAHALDLVEPEESRRTACADPSFHDTYVYGNVILNSGTDGGSMIHYGGDNGNLSTYRKGRLHFYNNTVIVSCDRTKRYRTILLKLETNDESALVRNNILYCRSETSGAPATELSLMDTAGSATFGVNWVSKGAVMSRSGRPFEGKTEGTDKLILSTGSPGFVSLSQLDLRLTANSPCAGKGEALAGAAIAASNLKSHLSQQTKGSASSGMDLGAFAKGAAPGSEPRTEP